MVYYGRRRSRGGGGRRRMSGLSERRDVRPEGDRKAIRSLRDELEDVREDFDNKVDGPVWDCFEEQDIDGEDVKELMGDALIEMEVLAKYVSGSLQGVMRKAVDKSEKVVWRQFRGVKSGCGS